MVLILTLPSISVRATRTFDQQPSPLIVAPGNKVTADIGPGQQHRYELALSAGTFLHLAVQQRGSDVIVRLFGPAGQVPLVEANSPLGGSARETIALVVERSGPHTLLIVPARAQARAGSFDVEVLAARPASEDDRKHVEAFGLASRAEQQRATGTTAGFRAARDLFTQAAPLFAAVGDRGGEADAVLGLGRAADALGEKKTALEIYARAREMYRRVANPGGEAFALNLAAVVHDFLGTRKEAMAVLEEAMPLARASGDPRLEALTLSNTGLIHHNTGDRVKAIALYEQALELHIKADNRRGEAVSLINIGTARDQLGEKPAALDAMLKALAIRREIGEPREEALALNNIGALYFSIDEAARALSYYEEALPRWRAAGDVGGEAATTHNIGNVYEFTGEYQVALKRFSDALVLHRKSGFKPGEANTLNNYGRLSATLGDHTRAIAAYTDAVAIHRAVNNQSGLATTLMNLGSAYLTLGDVPRASQFLDEALQLMRATKNPLGEANVLSALGRLALRKREFDRAVEALDAARLLYRSAEAVRGEASAIGLRAQVEAARGRSEEALTLVDSALERIAPLGDTTTEATLQHIGARISLDRGDIEGARRRNGAAIAVVESVRSRVAQEDLRTSYFATARHYYELEVEALLRLHEKAPSGGFDRQAFAVSEAARARALLDMLAEARANIRESVDPALLARERDVRQRLNVAAERQARLLAGRAPAARLQAMARDVARLTDEYQRVEADIRLASPRYRALTPGAAPSIDRVQRELLDGTTTLVEYMLGSERSVAWIVSRDSVKTVILPGRAAIETAARRFADAVAAEEASASAHGVALARLIFPPDLRRISTPRLAIAADGALHSAPLAALPIAPGGAPLVSRYALIVVPSAAAVDLIRADRQSQPASRSVVVLADPVFSAADARLETARAAVNSSTAPPAGTVRGEANEASTALPRLLNSRREAQRILSLLPGKTGRAVLDFDANRAQATGQALRRFGIVHFATHVLIDSRHPELSGIALSSVDRGGRPIDGFLRLHDIYGLDLDADLVVLSACRTAAGKVVDGEGIVGLTRGFMYAGARRVIATHWTVDDRATLELMTHFYRSLLSARRPTAAAALRDAQLQMQRSPRWRNPYYWSGFVLQGDWE